ncbi:MAG TPA: phosphatidylglycerophosphatase A [Candidatus Binataceae bacterium]|nr:phosphatidylglycerophosphatase A [Candidatus Binataceae bacterium]
METLISLAATGGYAGYIPIAPGTFGSLEGLFLGWFVFAPIAHRSPLIAIALFAVMFVAGCWIAGRAERIFAQHDSSRIVIDEIVAMVAAMFLLPVRWPWMVAAFGLFRLFDILKPFPASLIDRQLRGGAGVMLDDLAAAIYANLILQVARLLL